jgi:DNA-directed RNA polymerase II subunit RPB11
MSRNPIVSFSPKIGQRIEFNANCGLRDSTKDFRYVAFKSDLDPDRFELFLLEDDQKKVEEKAETRTYHPSPPPR